MANKHNRRSFFSKAALAGAGLIGASSLASYADGLVAAKERTSHASAPSDLKITNVTCAFVKEGHDLLVKIETNQGLVGWGNAVDAVNGSYYMVRNMGNRLKGQSPLNPNRIQEDLRKGAFFGGAQSGVYVSVMTAVEAALWDLTGKALGVPVYQLLGGKFRDKIRVYCDTVIKSNGNPTPDDYARAAKDAVKKGYTAVKFDIDHANDPNKYDKYNWTAGPAELDRMYNSIAAVRQAVGPKIDVCVDMHGRYDATTGHRVAKLMEPLNLMWLEEPVPADNVDVYKRITQETSTPICNGENLYLGYGFTRLLADGGTDIIMPDLQKAGGLGEAQRIANLANLYYVPFSPHMVATFLGAMASCHVCASVPNFQIMEWQTYMDTDPMFKEIVIYDKPQVEKGFITLSDKPGIGVDINEKALKKYTPQGMPVFA
ncbi:mandelate racemase/muconate lactonizing enzyme family protein [Adhaeribacter aquaticus]|uniref:mandelate racemase/muconate lactonizing enzyme family protein n=1 Tax=Adhaeribacter aquaticus TaxID=299567 RepID=UPI00040E70E7|nr:mandelate racemase/muconate lactonizing enzyme family protein [Adhaeribacter aquaticus]